MATDNAEHQCARCQRASRDKFIAPPEVPAEFWQTEQFSEAFAAQHIGRVARAYRMSPYHHAVYGPGGVPQGLLGQWFGLQQPQISRIETGPPSHNLDTLRFWARVLCIPPELLWFDLADQKSGGFRHLDDAGGRVVLSSVHSTRQACAGSTASQGSFLGNLGPLVRLAGEDGEDTMERRVFMLQAAVFSGLSVGGTASILEVVRHDLNRALVDHRATADVDEWQEITLEYGQTYLTTAPATLLQALIVDLHGVQLAIHRHPDGTAQRKLMQASALLAAFTAHTAADLGDLVEARRWWRTARLAADEAGDPYTMFWIRGREVVRAGYERRPVRAVMQLVNEAEARLDSRVPPEVLPEFVAGKAQTLALAGRHSEAEETLCQLRECFSKLPASLGHNDSLFDWGEEKLRYTESFVYSHGGNFAKAEQAQQAALTLYADSGIMRGPAQIELQRSLCLVRSGDVAQGTRHAQKTIANLPVVHRNRPAADLAQKVLGAIPARERRQSWAKEYDECLGVVFPGQVADLPPSSTRTLS